MNISEAWKQLSEATFSDRKVDFCVQKSPDSITQKVSFQASSETVDWLCNFLCGPWLFRGKIVHFGFWLQYIIIRKKVKSLIEDGRPINIVGYSLGGAIAQLCAYDLLKDGGHLVRATVFGSPRPFYFGTKKLTDRLTKVKYGNDAVTYLPFWCIPAKGTKIKLNESTGNPFKDHGMYGGSL